MGVIATWMNKYSIPFSLILTQFGLCFNFNMINSSELLKIDEISSDFHYNANLIYPGYIHSMGSNTLDLNQSLPWHAQNSQRHLLTYFYGKNYRDENPWVEKRGYHVIVHSNFEFPYDNEKNHIYVDPENFITIDINPIMLEADESLMELNDFE